MLLARCRRHRADSESVRSYTTSGRARHGNPVQLRNCDPGNLSQRWIVNDAFRYTWLESERYPFADLQGNGLDREVTLSYHNGRPNQWWLLYDK